jgi:hypothetical protein
MLTPEEVKFKIESGKCLRISAARRMSDKLRLHVNGEGLQEALARINGYENEEQFKAREKHAISNKFVTEELLRQVDNAFHARGGSKTYKFTSGNEDKLVDKLVNVKSNYSLSEYVEQEWFNRHVTDPNGLIFMEVDEDGESVEPTYKSIHKIRYYEQDGIFVDWVIFEPHIEGEETKQFWVVDEKNYYLYGENNKGVYLISEIPHDFGRVPAILCSNIVDSTTGWKKSPIDAQVELLDKYMVDNSVLNIAEFFHNYPIMWTYVGECKTCGGEGVRYEDDGTQTRCIACDGTGKATKKDVTDVTELAIPDSDGVKIDPPAGYITTPTDAWESMVSTLKRGWDMIYFSHWGTTVSKDSKNETATGRFIDAQPVNNRLNKYSKSIEQAHTEIANLIGQFYFPETFEKAIIQYGRRYLIETPDQIWEKYIKSKKDNAPVSVLNLLLVQFLESEFRENESMFLYEKKKVNLEPFVHWDIKTVQELSVSQLDYNKKLYFNEWITSLDIRYVIDTDEAELNAELTIYAASKFEVKGDTQTSYAE